MNNKQFEPLWTTEVEELILPQNVIDSLCDNDGIDGAEFYFEDVQFSDFSDA